MQSDPLDLIKHNFQEIYSAIPSSSEEPLTLVAWGNKIYSAKSCFKGRFVAWIDYAWSAGPDAIIRAIENTHQIFNNYKPTLQRHIKEAEEALLAWTREDTPNLNAFRQRFQPVLQYQEATRTFIKTLLHQHPKLTELFPQNSFFRDEHLYNQTGRLSRIYKLICMSGGCLPLKTFKNAVLTDQINEVDSKSIKKWLKNMRQLQGSIDSRALCKGLSALINFWSQDSRELNTVPIDEYIIRHHPDYLLPDPKHIAWRERIIEKRIAVIDSFAIGEAIKPKQIGFDNYITFAILNTPWVMVIPQNRAVIKIRHAFKENPSRGIYGIRSHRFRYVDPRGRYAIADRLAPIVDPTPLIGQLRWLAEQPESPSDLSFYHLGLTPEGYLVSVRNHEAKNFDYRSLEQVAYDFSKDNIKLYQRVINGSNLLQLPHARFFAACIQKGFSQEMIDVNELATYYTDHAFFPRDITDPKDVEHGQNLYNAARQAIVELYLSFRFEGFNPQALDTVIKDEVKKWWNDHCQGGRLWDNFKASVTVKINQRMNCRSLN